jgi:hypothetical protein
METGHKFTPAPLRNVAAPKPIVSSSSNCGIISWNLDPHLVIGVSDFLYLHLAYLRKVIFSRDFDSPQFAARIASNLSSKCKR